jgi:hypothetical protein
MRYKLARILFRLRFPSGNLRECDFRPHLPGYIINLSLPILPQQTAEQTRALAYRAWGALFRHAQRLRVLFKPEDCVQLIVGTIKPPRQILKGWLIVAKMSGARHDNLSDAGGGFQEFSELD